MSSSSARFVHYSPPSPTNNNSTSGNAAPHDWTRDLVKLAKTAELKKHALALQLATSQLITVHATLDDQQKAIEDAKEEKNRLESERSRLLECLTQVNQDRDKADLLLNDLTHKQTQTRTQITSLTSPASQYAISKTNLDRLRVDLGEQPLPGLQAILQDRVSKYLTERRINGKRRGIHDSSEGQPAAKKVRGRPKKAAGRPE